MKYLIFILCLILTINLSAKDKKVILTDKSPKPIGPYSQAIKAGSTIYLSGQIALDTATGKIAEGGASKEAEIILNNIKYILEVANCTFENIVKTTIYLTDIKDFNPVNKVYATYFTADFPARETIQVAGLPMGAHIEISVIAVK
ncbi:MAG: RidA family protein [Bacteroidetes bacterium]|nr:MAG: RidA family protein [Bacteroidota bacterium]